MAGCGTTDSDNTNLALSEAIINESWYELNVKQNIFTGEVLEKYSFADSEVTIDLYPMPCSLGTTFKPLVSFNMGYSIDGDKQITIGDLTYEASSITKDELILHFENQDGVHTKKLISKC